MLCPLPHLLFKRTIIQYYWSCYRLCVNELMMLFTLQDGWTALMVSSQYGHTEIVLMLLGLAEVNMHSGKPIVVCK